MTTTLTALFADRITAEQASERLRAIGIPERRLNVHPADGGGFVPRSASTGFFALERLVDRDGIEEKLTNNRNVLVASFLPQDIAAEASSILKETALEVDADRISGEI